MPYFQFLYPNYSQTNRIKWLTLKCKSNQWIPELDIRILFFNFTKINVELLSEKNNMENPKIMIQEPVSTALYGVPQIISLHWQFLYLVWLIRDIFVLHLNVRNPICQNCITGVSTN